MRLSSRSCCVCLTIRRFNRNSSLYSASARSNVQSNKSPRQATYVKVGEDIMPETTGTDPQKIDPHLTSKIVRSYVEHHTVATGDVSELITSVHGALSQLGRPNQREEVLTPCQCGSLYGTTMWFVW